MDIRLKLFQLLLRQKFLGKGLKGKRLIPQVVSYAITKACNLACIHCHANAREPLPDELSDREAKHVIGQIERLGTEVIIFSGGEPLLKKKLLLTLTEECTDYGIIPAMLTNGTLLDYETALNLKEAGMLAVGIPIDFSTPERQDTFRGVKGAFQAAVNAIKNCLAADLKVAVTTMVMKNNINEIPKVVELVVRLGVDQIILYDLVPVGRGKDVSELIIDYNQRAELLNFLCRVQEEMDTFFLISGGNPLYPGAILEMHRQHETRPPSKLLGQFLMDAPIGCHAGIHYLSLRPNGEVYPCPFLQISAGNIRKQSLLEIWQSSIFLQKLRNRDLLKGKCGTCKYKYVCGGCRARAYLYTGDPFEEDPTCPIETFQESRIPLNAIECFSLCAG